MQPQATQTNPIRSILAFTLIGILLLVAVILGVRWAKGRSDHYANPPQTQNTAQQNQPQANSNTAQTDEQKKEAERKEAEKKAAETKAAEDKKKADEAAAAAQKAKDEQAAKDRKAAEDRAKVAQAAPHQHLPATVPSTGVGDLFVTLIGFSLLAFVGIRYIQARRRYLRAAKTVA